MSAEPHIQTDTPTNFYDPIRVAQIVRHRELFFRVSARQATRRENLNWTKLSATEKAERIQAERTIGDTMGVPMIPPCFQTMENFAEWMANKNPAKYYALIPA